ncbi:MAG: DUF2971 domain-containing protein [Bacteroidota bacterium]|nr:DUF2971 domain-containing protein [Bacteroidota bacterium]
MLLYKYKPWNRFTKDIILNSRIYFPTKQKLNDPAELIHEIKIISKTWDESFEFTRRSISKAPFRLADSIHEKYRFLDAIVEDYPEVLNDSSFAKYYFSNDQFLHVAEQVYHQTSDFHNALKYFVMVCVEDWNYLRYTPQEILNKINSTIDRIGVLSLSQRSNCPVMWAHYSENHHGVVLIFDNQQDNLFSEARKVQYIAKRPIITFENVADVFYLKSNAWRYEKEIRVLKQQGNLPYSFNRSALKGIILGMHMADDTRLEIAELIRSKCPDVKLYQAKSSLNTYSVGYVRYK